MGLVPISFVSSRVCLVCVCVFRTGMVDGAGRHLAISLPSMCFVLKSSVRDSKQSCSLAVLDLLVKIGSEVRSKAAKERTEEV